MNKDKIIEKVLEISNREIQEYKEMARDFDKEGKTDLSNQAWEGAISAQIVRDNILEWLREECPF